jgi:hypothetical protein
MQPLLDWLSANALTVTEWLVALAGIAIAVVALTPTDRDDRALKDMLASLSAARKAAGGTALGAALAALAALLLGGCAHTLVAADTARAHACVEAERRCVAQAREGQTTVPVAEACVANVRLACDLLREEMLEDAE